MALERKEALVRKIEGRRAQFINALVTTPLVFEGVTYAFASLESDFMKCTQGEYFGIPRYQLPRYSLYHWIVGASLKLGYNLATNTYQKIFSSYLPVKGTLGELEAQNAKETDLGVFIPFSLFLVLVALQLGAGIEIPYGILMSANWVTACGFDVAERMINEFMNPGLKDFDLYIENTSLEKNKSVFFRTTREFAEDSENKEMVELMHKGTMGREGVGFFAPKNNSKQYALKAKVGSTRAYFDQTIDESTKETTFTHFKHKCKKH